MSENTNIFAETLRKYKAFENRSGRLMAAWAVAFFKENFTRQGFLNNGHVNPWPQRKPDMSPGKSLLIKKGALRRSVRVISASGNKGTVGTDLPYARIMNDGGTVEITPGMRKFFWAMWYKTQLVQWKNLALAKGPIKIKARQYIGDSTDLTKDIQGKLSHALQNALLE